MMKNLPNLPNLAEITPTACRQSKSNSWWTLGGGDDGRLKRADGRVTKAAEDFKLLVNWVQTQMTAKTSKESTP